ncbi:MAG: hypothetical protein ACE5HZ_09755 [Fidelibacterota bacterium]
MVYVLWVGLFLLMVLAGGVFFWVLRRPQSGDGEDADDLVEWDCPQCGFRVQMGTECIYCGEQRPGG